MDLWTLFTGPGLVLIGLYCIVSPSGVWQRVYAKAVKRKPSNFEGQMQLLGVFLVILGACTTISAFTSISR